MWRQFSTGTIQSSLFPCTVSAKRLCIASNTSRIRGLSGQNRQTLVLQIEYFLDFKNKDALRTFPLLTVLTSVKEVWLDAGLINFDICLLCLFMPVMMSTFIIKMAANGTSEWNSKGKPNINCFRGAVTVHWITIVAWNNVVKLTLYQLTLCLNQLKCRFI